MKKVIKLNEQDIVNIVKKVLKESLPGGKAAIALEKFNRLDIPKDRIESTKQNMESLGGNGLEVWLKSDKPNVKVRVQLPYNPTFPSRPYRVSPFLKGKKILDFKYTDVEHAIRYIYNFMTDTKSPEGMTYD